MTDMHAHCWHWNHSSKASLRSMYATTDEGPINGYTCCWCGEEKWEPARLSEHGPHHPYAPRVRTPAQEGQGA